MATKTVFKVTIITDRDFVGDAIEKFMKWVGKLLPLLQLTGFGEKVGVKDIDIKLSDRDV